VLRFHGEGAPHRRLGLRRGALVAHHMKPLAVKARRGADLRTA
jgi:hypothetical protein